jgi:ABC-type multidrug transport system fused ATPase/permease subunit
LTKDWLAVSFDPKRANNQLYSVLSGFQVTSVRGIQNKMSQQTKSESLNSGSSEKNNLTGVSPWRTLLKQARPFRGRILVIILLAALSTAAALVEPLIYRVAVNDVAGLFVDKAQKETEQQDTDIGKSQETSSRDANFQQTVYQEPEPTPRKTETRKQKPHHLRYEDPHVRGQVAPRTPQQTFNTFIWAVALMFGLSIFSYLIWLIADNMSAKVASRIETSFIQSVFGHVLRLPLAFFGKRASGALAKQVDQADQVSPIINAFAQTIVPQTMTIVGAFVIMLTQNWEMTLIALATLPPYFFIAWRSARRLEKGLEDYYAQWEDVSGRIQDSLSAIKTVKLSGAEARETGKFKETSVAAYQAYIQRTKLGNKFEFWEHSITRLGHALVLGIGGYFALRHELTPGDVVMFVAYVGMLYDPIDELTSLAIEAQQRGIALRRALRLTETEMEPQTGEQVESGQGAIEFKDIHFSYVPGREVLCGLTLTIKAGQVVGLVGPSGAGKTTTTDLLMRLYEPNSGEILIDGQKLSELEAGSVRREIGVVAADGAVFRGTLADNIRYKRPEATGEEVHAAALAAGLGNALERLPEGLQTKVGEGGMGLSVGERQRLQLARVLAANPRIMVLDEATANLDYATELEVKAALANLRKGRTTIVIAHRFSMVKDVDYVYVLDAGQVMEEGTPEQLIAARGWFARFAVSGSADENEAEDADIEEEGDDDEDAEE